MLYPNKYRICKNWTRRQKKLFYKKIDPMSNPCSPACNKYGIKMVNTIKIYKNG